MNSQRVETANGQRIASGQRQEAAVANGQAIALGQRITSAPRLALLLSCLLCALCGAAGAQTGTDTSATAAQKIPGMMAMLAHKTVIPKTDPYCNSERYSSPCTAVTVPRTFWHYDRQRGYRGIIDWVLIELRRSEGAADTATADTIVARKAAFLLSNGRVVDALRYTTRSPQPSPDDCPADIAANSPGCPAVWFDNVDITDGLYIVVRHRNHLDIMSARSARRQGDVYSWDFSASVEQALGGELGQGLNDGEVAAMFSGDANGNGVAEFRDALYTVVDNFDPIYADRDCNLDGYVTRFECGDYYNPLDPFPRIGHVSQVP